MLRKITKKIINMKEHWINNGIKVLDDIDWSQLQEKIMSSNLQTNGRTTEKIIKELKKDKRKIRDLTGVDKDICLKYIYFIYSHIEQIEEIPQHFIHIGYNIQQCPNNVISDDFFQFLEIFKILNMNFQIEIFFILC